MKENITKVIKKIIPENILNKIFPRSEPDFLIIGAQKSGTTSLHYYLCQHPSIMTALEKEVNYFNKPGEHDFKWYLSNFPRKINKKGRLTLDATPGYINTKTVPAQIKEELGFIKCIAILRDPVHRAFSDWNMFYNQGRETRTFDEMLSDELQGITKKFIYLERGNYAEQLKRYFEIFGREWIHIIDYKDFCDNLPETLNEVCKFIGIEPIYTHNIEKENPKNIGKYNQKITQEQIDILRNFYEKYDKNLELLCGKKFSWMK